VFSWTQWQKTLSSELKELREDKDFLKMDNAIVFQELADACFQFRSSTFFVKMFRIE
jgi:hypothetical protein